MRNIYEVRGDVTAVIINSRKYGEMETLISTSQLEKVNQFSNTWVAQWNVTTQSFYAIGSTGSAKDRKRIMLHRFITDAESGFDVDHINHDTLDNTDTNLRLLTRSENGQNRKCLNSRNKSGVRNVSWNERDQRWRVCFVQNKKTVHIGQYRELEEARRVAEEARPKYLPYACEETAF